MAGWGLGLVAAALLSSPAAPARETPRGTGGFRMRIRQPALAQSVYRALLGARRRLGNARCSAVLGDFQDPVGHPLQANLDALQQTPAGYLSLIIFYDGQGHSACRGRTVAFTAPGGRVVWICPQFAFEQRRDPAIAEAIVVHEMLHSLGLSENPPSPDEITAGVMARCGL